MEQPFHAGLRALSALEERGKHLLYFQVLHPPPRAVILDVSLLPGFSRRNMRVWKGGSRGPQLWGVLESWLGIGSA